jgi:hypothetical protein
VFERFNLNLPPEEYARMMQKFDHDGSGSMNYQEFLTEFGQEFLGKDTTDIDWGANRRSERAELALEKNRQEVAKVANDIAGTRSFVPVLLEACAAQSEATRRRLESSAAWHQHSNAKAGKWWERPPQTGRPTTDMRHAQPPPTATRRMASAAPTQCLKQLGRSPRSPRGHAEQDAYGPVSITDQLPLPTTRAGLLLRRQFVPSAQPPSGTPRSEGGSGTAARILSPRPPPTASKEVDGNQLPRAASPPPATAPTTAATASAPGSPRPGTFLCR